MKVMAFVLVALAAFFGTCSATQYVMKANYVMRNANHYPNAYVNGTVYYLYDTETSANSRVRYDTSYKLSATKTVSNTELFHYQNGAIYTICVNCSATLFAAPPSQWWGLDTDTKERLEGAGGNNEYWYKCTRDSLSSYGVIELEVRGRSSYGSSVTFYKPGETNYNIRRVKFQDGRELILSGYEKISYSQNKFELPSNPKCPEPECRSFVDIVFVLDTSISVNDNEWNTVKSFLKKAIEKFSFGESNAMVGVVEFNAPSQTCSWSSCCANNLTKKNVPDYNGWTKTRYLDDCLFDWKCDLAHDTTANILVNLTYDRVQDKISNIQRSSGHTCQRYGLQLAYKMLFENNPRCKEGLCPVPIVIVVTDGADFCHTSTEEWANIIKAKDDRGYLLEIGVGLEAPFDVEYIMNLSSSIGGQKAALNVQNYDKIDEALDTIIKPVCEIGELGGSCGPECKGFCACGECVCPVCDDSADFCNYYACGESNPENGCQERTVTCMDEDVAATQCYNQWCDGSEQDPSKKCKAEKIDCTEELKKQGHTFKTCQIVDCVNNTGGCDIGNVINDDTICQNLAGKCKIGRCDPGNASADKVTGCVFDDNMCTQMHEYCLGDVYCDVADGKCKGDECDTKCVKNGEPLCEDKPCMITHCDNSSRNYENEKDRCSWTPMECKQQSENNCKEFVCKDNQCVEVPVDKLNCADKGDQCVSYSCVASADNGKGACVGVNKTHDSDNCTVYVCDPVTGWNAMPKCTTDKACKVARCSPANGGVCREADISCKGKVNITNKCFQAICKEPKGCQKKLYDGAYVDICGQCIRADDLGSDSITESQETACIEAPEQPMDPDGLAAAAVALIVLLAVIIGAAVAVSTVLGTKALIDRARGAQNQSVVSNPLFEDSQTEMSNPAFAGDTV